MINASCTMLNPPKEIVGPKWCLMSGAERLQTEPGSVIGACAAGRPRTAAHLIGGAGAASGPEYRACVKHHSALCELNECRRLRR